MNWIGKKNKKVIPDELKVKRAKIILIVMAVVIAVIVFVPRHKKEVTTGSNPTEVRMNETLDSLIKNFGYNEYKVFYTGEMETLTESLDCPEKDLLATIEMRIDMITSMTTISEKEKMKRLDEALAEKKALQEKVKAFEANRTELTYYSRRIRFSVPDGRKFTFFQQVSLEPAFVKTKYFKEISNSSSNAQKELEKIQKEFKKQ